METDETRASVTPARDDKLLVAGPVQTTAGFLFAPQQRKIRAATRASTRLPHDQGKRRRRSVWRVDVSELVHVDKLQARYVHGNNNVSGGISLTLLASTDLSSESYRALVTGRCISAQGPGDTTCCCVGRLVTCVYSSCACDLGPGQGSGGPGVFLRGVLPVASLPVRVSDPLRRLWATCPGSSLGSEPLS